VIGEIQEPYGAVCISGIMLRQRPPYEPGP
jgi:hypothetical protein